VTGSTVLVVAAHPDDEILGCGGAIARHAGRGDRVHIAIVAEGETSRDNGDAAAVSRLRDAAAAAARTLGAEAPVHLGLPDNRLDSIALLDVVKEIENVIGQVSPSIVYTHHGGDLNIDHRVVHQAVVTACRPLPGSTIEAVRCFETVSSTEWASDSIGAAFRPTQYVNIDAFLAIKLEALQHYEMEMRPFPHARSLEAIEALARLRGSQAGFAAAEAFSCLFERIE